MNSRNKTFRLVLRATLLAIIIVQTMVPWLGFVPLGFVSLTTIHITVIIVTAVLDPKDDMVTGLSWGIVTIVRAYVMPTTPLDTLVFTNLIISIILRVLVGLVAGLVFRWIYQENKSVMIGSAFVGVLGSSINTALVLGSTRLFYTGITADTYGIDSTPSFKILTGITAINGTPEAIDAGTITPLLAKVLLAAAPLKPE